MHGVAILRTKNAIPGPTGQPSGEMSTLRAGDPWIESHSPWSSYTSDFFFFCVPGNISRVHHFGGEIFAYVSGVLSNHRGSHVPSSWMVHAGCFLLLAFTRQGHACQDLLSLCDGVHVCTR